MVIDSYFQTNTKLNGYIVFSRNFIADLLNSNHKWSDFEMWTFFLCQAEYQDQDIKISKKEYDLYKGDFVFSQKKLIEKSKWNNQKFKNFLEKKQNNGELKWKKLGNATYFRIENYESLVNPDTYRREKINETSETNDDVNF